MPYRVDGGVGRYHFQTHLVEGGSYHTARDLFAPLKGKELYRTRWFRQHALLEGCTELSYRKTCEQLNAIRHQREGTTLRSLCNAAEAEAEQVQAYYHGRAVDLLADANYDEAGRPQFTLSSDDADPHLMEPALVQEALDQCLQAADAFPLTAEELLANPLPYEAPDTQVMISIDDVGVKKQKLHRKPTTTKPLADPRKRAWTTVAHISYGPALYCLVADSTHAILRLIAGLLAASDLQSSPLLFFTDGQRTLKDTIFDFFARRGRLRLILDWYHLQKKCRELGSLGLKGTIAAKKVHIEALRRLLWYGLVDRAIAYLDTLPEQAIKRPDVIEQINGYFERNRAHIPCYALRRQLGLRCSSNRVEKDNDLVVAQRQKRNGMSWSEDGSHALATLKALRQSQEQEHWLTHRTLAFTLPKSA